MIVHSIKTVKIAADTTRALIDILDQFVTDMPEKSVLAIASKVAGLCEGRVAPVGLVQKDELVARESQWYLPSSSNPYGVSLAIAGGNLVASAGVDESNGDGHYVLWPANPQKTANSIREYLAKRFSRKEVGVILTDSTTRPLQWGTTGIAIASSGFEPIKSYIGATDLFGRPFDYHTNNLANGLAAAAALVMGEGAEQTPLALLSGLDMVAFTGRNPTARELAALGISLEKDLYAQFLKNAAWQKGQKQ